MGCPSRQSPDLQVEGDRGTGKTTVCLAAAVGSVSWREHVASLHSNSEIKEVLHRLKKIHDANLDGMISAARLDGAFGTPSK